MDLHDYFDPTYRDSEIMELDAIWVTDVCIVDEHGNRKARFEPGDHVRIENKRLHSGEPTHRIVGCFGTILSNKLEFMVEDLSTGELSIAKP